MSAFLNGPCEDFKISDLYACGESVEGGGNCKIRLDSRLADTQELSSSLALSRGLEILQVASSGSYIKSSAILAQESVQGFRWRDPCQVMPMQWVPLSASQSISVEIP